MPDGLPRNSQSTRAALGVITIARDLGAEFGNPLGPARLRGTLRKSGSVYAAIPTENAT